MRRFILLIALLFACPTFSEAQTVVRRSDLTVMLDNQLYYLHTVRRKETLYSIAAAYGTTVKDIVEKNPFAETEIKPGQTLLVPSIRKDEPSKPATTPSVEQQTTPPADGGSKSEHLPFITDDYELPQYGDQGDEISAENPIIDTVVERVTFGQVKPIDRYRPIKVVMMLPFGGMRGEENFVDFYRGASLAFDQIDRSGTDMLVEIISTSASPSVVQQIIAGGKLDDADMIIGPVYSEIFEIVADYAVDRRIPIISPLGSVGAANNAMVVEVAPTELTKWAKLIPVFNDPRSNVILVTSATATDTSALWQIEPLLPQGVQRIDYAGKATNVGVLSGSLRRDMKNVIVAPLSDESLIENLLSRYSSINIGGRNDITVVGTPRWARFNNMNLELFFKLSVTYPTTYFFDRLDEGVGEFYRTYISRYESLPTLYSFRGYDVMMIFGRAIAQKRERMFDDVVAGKIKLLQVPYKFHQVGDEASKIVNSEWALVQYLPSFRIEVL